MPENEVDKSLDEWVVNEIFALQEFRDWWRVMTGKHGAQFRYKMPNESWGPSFAAFKNLRARTKELQK